MRPSSRLDPLLIFLCILFATKQQCLFRDSNPTDREIHRTRAGRAQRTETRPPAGCQISILRTHPILRNPVTIKDIRFVLDLAPKSVSHTLSIRFVLNGMEPLLSFQLFRQTKHDFFPTSVFEMTKFSVGYLSVHLSGASVEDGERSVARGAEQEARLRVGGHRADELVHLLELDDWLDGRAAPQVPHFDAAVVVARRPHVGVHARHTVDGRPARNSLALRPR